MPSRFSLGPDIILRSEPQYYNTYALFDYREVKTEFLTVAEYNILKHISTRPAEIEEIWRVTGGRYDQCQKFLKRMLQSGYIQEEATTPFIKIPDRTNVDPALYDRFSLPILSAPTSVDVFITNRCNLNCVHCFSSKDEINTSELSFQELQSVFDQLESLGVFEVRINGGEPLLHPKIREVLMTLGERRFHKVILTNGTLLNDETIGVLEEGEITPTLSLDGSRPEEHDLFRGMKGSFNKTLEALRLLKSSGIQYGINCCLHRENLRKCKEIIELAVEYGASRIAFLDLKPVGRMRNHMAWVPTYDEYRETMLYLMVAKMHYRRKIDVAIDTFLHCQPLKESIQEAKRGYVSCQAGRNRLSIDSNGAVYPCNLVISDPRWSVGNMREDTILNIWFSPKWTFFRGTRIDDLRRCRVCRGLASCQDFYCRLIPYASSGNPFGPHPRCT